METRSHKKGGSATLLKILYIRYRNLLPVGRYPYKELGSNFIFNLFPMNREGAVDAKMRRTATLLRTTLPLESQLDNPGGTTGA